jgi:hypothetical protein
MLPARRRVFDFFELDPAEEDRSDPLTREYDRSEARKGSSSSTPFSIAVFDRRNSGNTQKSLHYQQHFTIWK